MIIKNKIRIIYIFTIMILIMIIMTPLIYSWLFKMKESTYTINTGVYQIDVDIYFGTTLVLANNEFFSSATNTTIIDASDMTKINYIENVKVILNITPPITSRIRVKILDEWHLKRIYNTIPSYSIDEIVRHDIPENGSPDALFPFIISSAFPYIRDNVSGYYYYTPILSKNVNYSLEFIIGGPKYPVRLNPSYYEECYVNLDFIVEAVQANRFSEIWNIPNTYFN